MRLLPAATAAAASVALAAGAGSAVAASPGAQAHPAKWRISKVTKLPQSR